MLFININKGDYIMKIISWNVNGIKSTYKSGNLKEVIKKENPDILCIQEIKTKEVPNLDGYTLFSYPASKSTNFYGTAIYTKIEPLSIDKGFDDEEFDAEGRIIRCEFESFNLYNVYSPSGAGSKEKLTRKYRFYDEFTEYLRSLKSLLLFVATLTEWLQKLILKDLNL